MSSGLAAIRERASLVMVPSETVAEDCREHGFDSARVRVVPWGVRQGVPDDDEVDRVRRRHGLDGPFVLFVGTLEPRKNLAGLLDALVHLGRPELSLVLVGPQGWGDPVAGRSGVGLGDVPGPVVRLGVVPEAELTALQRAADVCCVPSLAEGFGLPALEAMACRTPLVATRYGGTPDLVTPGESGYLVDVDDAETLAMRALDVLSMREREWSRMSEAAHRAAHSHTWADASCAFESGLRRAIEKA